MKAKWPYVVKISDPKKLKQFLNDKKPVNTKMELFGKCRIEKVSYTKREPIDIDPDSFEAVRLSYTQKPRSYENECEFRYIITALPSVNHQPDKFLEYNFGIKIDYASFI